MSRGGRQSTQVMGAEIQQQLAAIKEEKQRLDELFNKMDANRDGKVTKEEFGSYLSVHPEAWPLGELLSGVGSATTKSSIVVFWFKKVDRRSNGYFGTDDLFQFLKDMADSTIAEGAITELLLELFDSNFDGKLQKSEFETMLRSLLGVKPSAAALAQVPVDGLTKDGLKKLLHDAGCDIHKLDPHYGATSGQAQPNNMVDVAIVVALVVGVAVGFTAFLKARKQ